MSRAQRRAAAARGRAARSFGDIEPSEAADPSKRYLTLSLRQMTVADMVPGYSYAPGCSLLQVDQPATLQQAGSFCQIPIDLPVEMREPTPLNTLAVYEMVMAKDPEARALVEAMKLRASAWSDVVAAHGIPKRIVGPIITPPTEPTPPLEALEISSSRN